MKQEKKAKPTLSEWFIKATGSGNLSLTVPPHITSLPCGCTREPSDPFLFKLKRKGSAWFHDHVSCRQSLDMPKVSVSRARISDGLHGNRNSNTPYSSEITLH